jgi:hypothetical protein
MSLLTREKKYQFIKLMEAGISLHEANTLARIVNVASMCGYMEEDDFKVLNEIMDKLERFAGLLETRTQKKKRIIKKYSRAKGEDRIANFFTTGLGAGLNKKTNFTRFGILKRQIMKTRAETRPGSSVGKIGRTKVIGHKKLNRDIDNLAKSLNNMIASFERIGDKKAGAKAKAGAINDFIGSIRTSVNIKGRK